MTPAAGASCLQAGTFTVFGGPLYRFGRRLGLVRGANTVPLGLSLGGALWLVLLLFALIEGLVDPLFSLSAIGVHVRLLVALPLFFVGETLLAPCLATFFVTVVRAEVVPASEMPAFRAAMGSMRRLADAWLPELLCLLGAVAMLLAGSHLPVHGATAALDPERVAIASTLTGQWYAVVCLTVVRFVLLRWLWWLLLWSVFLWRLSRLDLHLVPTHPDRQAGLGYLQAVHAQLMPTVGAISAIQAAGLAEEVARGTMAFEAMAPAVVLLVAVAAALVLGPLVILAPRLRSARLAGQELYMELGSRYVNAFEKKWLASGEDPGEPFLGTSDVGSLADLQTSFGAVEDMRWIPVSFRLTLLTLAAALLPMALLLLLKYPIDDLSRKLIERLVGA